MKIVTNFRKFSADGNENFYQAQKIGLRQQFHHVHAEQLLQKLVKAKASILYTQESDSPLYPHHLGNS